MPKKVWKDSYTKFLKRNYDKMTQREIAESLGVRLGHIRFMCYKHGLIKAKKIIWTFEEKAYLSTHYRLIGDVELAKNMTDKFGRPFTKQMIEHAMSRMNLKRSDDEVERIKKNNIRNRKYKKPDKKFKDYQTTIWTRKGRKYKLIYLDGKFIFMNRFIWESVNGPIPKDKCVVFKDGNPMNCSIDNLELKSKKEIILGNRDTKKNMETWKNKQKQALNKVREIIAALKRKRVELKKVSSFWEELNSPKVIARIKTNEYITTEKRLASLKDEMNKLKSEAIKILPFESKYINKKTIQKLNEQIKNL